MKFLKIFTIAILLVGFVCAAFTQTTVITTGLNYPGDASKFLSGSGAWLTPSGGDTIWDNTDGVIAPASGQDTNVLRFTSGLPDNATNVAVVVDMVEPWGIAAKSLTLRNNGTNVAWFNAQGGLNIGRTSADNWGATGGLTIFKDDNADENLGAEIVVGHTDGGSIFRYVDIQGEILPAIEMHYDGSNPVRIRPATTDGNTAHIFDTVVSHSSGLLTAIGNNGTNKVSVTWDGRLITQSGTAITPATAGAAGTAGTIIWDADFIYVCVAANTWKRVAIATW